MNKKITFLFSLLAILNCFFSVFGQPSTKTSQVDLINRAKSAIENNETAMALVDLNSILKADPKNVAALQIRADIYKKQGQYDQSLMDLNKLISLNNRNDVFYFERATVYLSRSKNIGDADYVNAKADTIKALKINSDNVSALILHSKFNVDDRKYEFAINDLEYAKKLDPDREWLDMMLEAVRKTQQDARNSQSAQVKKDEGNNSSAVKNNSLSVQTETKKSSGSSLLDKPVSAAKPDTEADKAAIAKIRAVCEKGSQKTAIPELNEIIARAPQSSNAYSVRGLCFANNQDLTNALADAEKSLSLDPNNVLALTVRGFYKTNRNDAEGGVKDLERALMLAPNDALAGNLITSAYRAHPNPLSLPTVAEKLKNLKKEVEQSNQNYETYLKLDDFLASIRQFELGESYFLSLAKSDEKNVCAYYFAGKGYNYINQKEYFDKAMNNFDGRNGARCSAEAAFDAGRYYAEPASGRMTNEKEALKFYNLALKRDPNIPFVDKWKAKLSVKDSDSNSGGNTEVIREQERIAQVNRLYLQYYNDIVARSNKVNQYAKERENLFDTTAATRAKLLTSMKQELSVILEIVNKALAEIGNEVTPDQKKYFLRIQSTAKARLEEFSKL